MKLPNADRAIISSEKLRDYLLSSSHPVGKFKAVFFRSIGFADDNWQELETAIRSLIAREKAYLGDKTDFGQKYEISGTITGPYERKAQIVTVWIVREGESVPRFITAFPGGSK